MAQLTYGSYEDMYLNTGMGADTIILSDTHPGATTVNANDGADLVVMQMTSGTTTVNGQGDDDQFIVQNTGAGQTTTLNGDAGLDAFTVQATGLGSVTTLNGGDAADTFDVQTIAGDTTVNAGAGNDTVNVSSDAPTNLGTLNGLAAALFVYGNAGVDILNVSDIGDPTNNTGDLTSTQLTGLGMGGALTYGGFEILNITLGSGYDLISVHSTHTPGITNLDAGPGDDTYLVFPHWGDIIVTERAGGGTDTLDFTPVPWGLIFLIGVGRGVSVSDGLSLLYHPDNRIEHLIGSSGDDWFVMGPGSSLAGGRGTITGGLGYDILSYEHYAPYYHRSIYNGVGLAAPADVEHVIFPPEPPAKPDVIYELLGYYGAGKSLDELIDLVLSDPGTYRPGSSVSLPLNVGVPTSILTPANNLVVFSSSIGGVVEVRDLVGSDIANYYAVLPGNNYIGQGGRVETFSATAEYIRGIQYLLSNGSASLSTLPDGESMAVIFQLPAYMLGRTMSIMWWDEARGMWREIAYRVTPDGRCIAITNLTGTFILVTKD